MDWKFEKALRITELLDEKFHQRVQPLERTLIRMYLRTEIEQKFPRTHFTWLEI